MMRIAWLVGLLWIVSAASTAHAQVAVLSYPTSGNLNAAAGTIEFWLRLETEPEGGKAYFPIFEIGRAGAPVPGVRFSYQNIWNKDHFHFFWSSHGQLNGQTAANPYFTTTEDTQLTTKGESSSNRTPRMPRLKKGEWHHVALTWQSLPQSIVTIYFDARLVAGPLQLQVPLWDSLDDRTLSLHTSAYHDTYTLDDLHISSIARDDTYLKATCERGKIEPDRFSLLLDRFEDIREADGKKSTAPEIICRTIAAGTDGGLVAVANCVTLVNEGKTGKGLKTLGYYNTTAK